MSKVDVNKVAAILRRNLLEPAVMRRVIEELNKEVQVASAENAEKPPSQKKQYVIILCDPDGVLPEVDLAGWVVQLTEDASPLSAIERLQKAAYDFNASRRGRKLPVETMGEALESVPAKHFKEVDTWVKTKVPVQVVKTNNVLPRA